MELSFDEIAAQFDDQRGLPKAALREWIAFVASLANGRWLRVIEPGIGTGRIALPLAVAGHHVTGVDISAPMLDACARRASEMGVAERMTLLQGDATSLPVNDHAFDLGVMASLLYLVPDWDAVLDELHRVVIPGGAILHLVERTESGENLRRWDIAWRERIEGTGYRHASLRPTSDEVVTEFRRRWPETRVERLASWTFGQTVAEGRHRFDERLCPLYAGVDEGAWSRVVGDFLRWSEEAFPNPATRLDGDVVLEVLIARP
ncbi:MAG TPA: class I SAM-dependent methyltransferase [Thermomicrobiales bacterium]|nr:class I SAM-dependent methyltransferase [Thermomicrobiales bacterium]